MCGKCQKGKTVIVKQKGADCLPIYLSIYPSISLSLFIYLSISLSVSLSVSLSLYLSLYLFIYPVYLFICLSIYPSFHLSVYPSFHLSIYPSMNLSIYLSERKHFCEASFKSVLIYQSINQSIYLSIFLSICLPVCLSIYLKRTTLASVTHRCLMPPHCTCQKQKIQGSHFGGSDSSISVLFSTSEHRKVVRACGALYILTSICASRCSSVQFLISRLPNMALHPPLYWDYFSTLQSHKTLEKNTALSTFRPFRAPWSSFCWLFLFWLLLFSASSHLCCFNLLHLSILSEVWLLNFPSMVLYVNIHTYKLYLYNYIWFFCFI